MARKGLNKDKIVLAAAELSEEKGYTQLSVQDLAEKLEVKPAFLILIFSSLNFARMIV